MSPSERLEALRNGDDPLMIARMRSGFAVMSSAQYLPGYCLLLAFPEVEQLNDMDQAHRLHFLEDMARLGDAVRKATGCIRLNYGIYGNLDPFLHAHIWPRYASERPRYRSMPPMSFPDEFRQAEEHRYDPDKHYDLQSQIALRLMPE